MSYKGKRREVRRPPRASLCTEERMAIRKAGAQGARRSRLRQGLPERIEDPAAIALLAALLHSPRSTQDKESTGDGKRPAV